MFVDTIYAHIYIDCAVSATTQHMPTDVLPICHHKQLEYHVDDSQCFKNDSLLSYDDMQPSIGMMTMIEW